MVDAVLERTEPRISPPVVLEKHEPLKNTYIEQGARYRELSRRQFDSGLTGADLDEKISLEKKAGFGLFNPDLTEDQLAGMESAFNAINEAEKLVFSDPGGLSERFRQLGKKLYDQGLNPEELREFNRLDALASQGKFQSGK